MAKRKIVWTEKANLERKEILSYWIERNQSKVYSIKLNKLIVQTLKQLADNPSLGRKTEEANVRIKLIRDYLLFYEVKRTEIVVLTIWDGRRSEDSLKL